MAKAINVKISTVKVIKALETRLAELNKNYANQEANEAKYDKVVEKWNKEIVKLVVPQMAKMENFSAFTRYDGTTSVSFNIPAGLVNLPEQPKREFEQIVEWKYNEQVEEMENALRILKMTDEETVNASTMKSISQYL